MEVATEQKRAKDYIIVAIDKDNAPDALKLIHQLKDEVCIVKIGMELLANVPDFLKKIPKGIKVFLDRKYIDIPNSVAGAIRAAVRDGVWMVNVMAMGGKAMMQAAAKAAKEESEKLGVERPLVVAVTLLTSIDQKTLKDELRVNRMTTQEYVVHLAKLAQEAGLDGVVCSADDVAMIRQACGDDFVLVTPGIRLADSDTDDQKRVGTPEDAIKKGADYLVIGRPITKAEDPASATRVIAMIIKSALLYTDVALSLYRDGAIKFGAFKLKSHKLYPGAPDSPIFFSIRLKGSSQEHEGTVTLETFDKIGQLITDSFDKVIGFEHSFIAGIPSAAEPIVDAIMKHLPDDATVKRLYLEKVGTGEERRIALKNSENYPRGKSVVLIDDLITKADTKIEAAGALRSCLMFVGLCIVIIDREQGGPEEAEANGLVVYSIYKMDDILDFYYNRGLITAKQVVEVKTYKQRFDEYVKNNPPVAA